MYVRPEIQRFSFLCCLSARDLYHFAVSQCDGRFTHNRSIFYFHLILPKSLESVTRIPECPSPSDTLAGSLTQSQYGADSIARQAHDPQLVDMECGTQDYIAYVSEGEQKNLGLISFRERR